MRSEQEFLDLLHDRLDDLRAEAEGSLRSALPGEPGGTMQARLERDILVAERSGLLTALESGENGLVFGRLWFGADDADDADDTDGNAGRHSGEDRRIGRIGIRADDEERTPLVIDWRAEIARPFYLATAHTPMGLRRRRHIATEGRKVTGLHDEILDLTDTRRTGHEGADADAVLLSALDSARTGRMHDIVETIQAEQDRIIRAPEHGALVVEGGPGTGKTVVALHRAAYLLYAHRERLARRAVLIVGPNPAFLEYISEVLPSLGETGVLLASPGELFPGVRATGSDTERAAAVKGHPAMAEALAAYVRDLQRLPDPETVIAHEDGELVLDAHTVRAARDDARATGLPHNLARPHFAFRIIDALTDQLVDRIGADPLGGPNLLGPDDAAQLGKAVATSREVHAAIEELWPQLTPEQLVARFLEEPGPLPAPLTGADAEAIRRDPADLLRPGGPDEPWTPADVPLLDEAAELLGRDDSAEQAAAEAERQRQIAYAQGVLELSYGSRTYEFEDRDDEESELLSAHDLIDAERLAERSEEADHRTAAERAAADRGWAFGHIIVDEAQELSPMMWRLLMRRCPTRSMTLVGDPAQTSEPGGTGSWEAILSPYLGDRWKLVRLGVNYRTPQEIMDLAAEIPRALDPDFEPPRSIRSTGVPPWRRSVPESWLPCAVAEAARAAASPDHRHAVIAPEHRLVALAAALPEASHGRAPDLTRPIVLLGARQAKGLEFDTVLVAAPEELAPSDRYVALTRATQRLGLLDPEPAEG
ncbi:HelD family protein [Phaeacidiphilus oryzae]|uniref:HelD family protein n=1 Tax=Phaeacidiphilus oryzae TaxID=348818 RepID=UPI000565AB34|nr:AAA family ATPase [Phaeacidiphilus oryzae]